MNMKSDRTAFNIVIVKKGGERRVRPRLNPPLCKVEVVQIRRMWTTLVLLQFFKPKPKPQFTYQTDATRNRILCSTKYGFRL